MILDYLDRVRTKPLHARRRFAFFVALGSTALIATAWAFTLPARLSSLHLDGESMVGSAGMQELEEQVADSKEGLQEVIDMGNEIPEYVTGELRAELERQMPVENGGGVGGDEGAYPLTDMVATSTTPAPRPVIVEVISKATTSTSSTTH